MRIPAKIADTFSPYLDDYVVVDFFDDFGKRGAAAILATLTLNCAFFAALTMSSHYILIPPEPDIIPIRIVASVGESEDPPAPKEDILPAPAIPTPSPAPTPRPQPKPKPATPAPLPAPQPELGPEPEVEVAPIIQPIAPAPKIISQPDTEPDKSALPDAPDIMETEKRESAVDALSQQIEPPIIPEVTITPPLPDLIVSDAPALISAPNMILEDSPETTTAPQPETERPLEPEIEPDIAPVIEEQTAPPGPVIEDIPIVPPDEIIITPNLPDVPEPNSAPGIIDPLPDINEPIELETTITPSTPVQPDNAPEAPANDAPIVTTAPRVLADDDDAQSQREIDRAVPQSQADSGPRGGYQTPVIGGGGRAPIDLNPPAGGGRQTGPVAGTERPSPGASGWSLGAGAQGDYDGEGGMRGVLYDTRCRDESRMHEDCPEYVAKPRGRDVDGYETPRINRGASSQRGPSAARNIGGATGPGAASPFSASSNGMPSTTVLDDTDFGVLYGRTPKVDIENTQPRLSDMFEEDQGFINDTDSLPALGDAPPLDVDDPWALDKLPD